MPEKPVLPTEMNDADFEAYLNSVNKEDEKPKKSAKPAAKVASKKISKSTVKVKTILEVDSVNEIKIGKQIWTTKNLDVSTYRNGDIIPQVQSEEEWANLSTGAWCYYENKTSNGKKYGKLYNWYAVNDPRGLTPNGYHIPTDKEWSILADYLGGDESAGAKMKSKDGWKEVVNGKNSIGFDGLPGGFRSNRWNFNSIGTYVYWWSSTKKLNDYAYFRSLSISLYRNTMHKQFGCYIRCIKD
jgi:uncharacterized protein (TIGR02145 family)